MTGDPILRTRNSGYGGSGYSIPTDVVNGKPRNVPGVTTITGVTDKPALRQYYADTVAAKAVASPDALLSRTMEEGFKYLRYAGNYANKEAIENGKIVHGWIEAFMSGGFEPELQNFEQESMVAEFLEWRKDQDIEVLLTEATVYNPDAGYAGTLDWLWRLNGALTLGDHKTGKGMYVEHHQQLAALGAAPVLMRQVDDGEGALYESKVHGKTYWVEDVVPEFTQYAILHIRPPAYDFHGKAIAGFCELHTIEQWRIDINYRGFLGALELKRAERDIKDMELRLEKQSGSMVDF